MTAADDTDDHTFCFCQHPLLCQARAKSDGLLLTVPLLTDLDHRLFPALLRLVQEVDGHRICVGNWNLSQITQLNQVLLSTDSVTALSESLLALSKHLVNRIDILWAARQQAAYHTALSNTPEADMVLLLTLQRRCLKRRIITASAPTVFYAVRLGMFRVYTPPGGMQSPIPLASSRTSSISPHGRKPRTTCPSPRALEILCLITLLRFCSLMARLSSMARPDGEFTSPSRAYRRPAQYKAQSPQPLQDATG